MGISSSSPDICFLVELSQQHLHLWDQCSGVSSGGYASHILGVLGGDHPCGYQ